MTACEAPLATECQIACEPGQKYYVMGPTKADRIVAWRKPGLWSDGFDSLEYFDSIEAARAVIDKHTRQPRTPGVLTVLDVAGAIRLKASGNEYSADLIRAAEGIEQYGQVRKTPLAALPAEYRTAVVERPKNNGGRKEDWIVCWVRPLIRLTYAARAVTGAGCATT